MSYLLQQSTARKTPHSQPILGREKEMTRNNAGGFAFKADSFSCMERFLILGSEGGTYYVGESDLTKQNVDNIRACIGHDGPRAIQMIVDISTAGRAPKNDPAIYALALAASYGGDVKVRQGALDVLPKVARIGTHLFQFCAFIDTMRGWGPALRKAVGAWYLDKPADKLGYQIVKYQQRNGWSHSDVLRLAHPKADLKIEHANLFRYVRKGIEAGVPDSRIIEAFEFAKTADEARCIGLIRENGLTREMIPTEHHKSPAVWEALLEKMPLTAMIRTLGRMGSVGLLAPLSDASKLVVSRLGDREALRGARVHPIQVLSAMLTYGAGHGVKGSLTWTTVPQVMDALNEAFYVAFDLVEPTGKNFYLGLDVSGSMSSGLISGVPGLTPRMGTAAMAMLVARTEPNFYAAGFSDGSRVRNAPRGQTQWAGLHGNRFVPAMEPVPISKSQRLDAVMKQMEQIPMGGTDCALPMLDALHNNLKIDCFIVYTDNETWAGTIHPKQALDQYRQKTGIDAKLIVCGMTATGFSIADPSDRGMLDIVGFDTSVPTLINGFLGAHGTTGQDDSE